MKYSLPIYLILIFGCFSAQQNKKSNNKEDALKKYSYYIGFEIVKFYSGGSATVTTGNGTGFFIRDKEELYLVTARHNVVPCENYEKLFLKNIFVWLQDKSGSPTERILIEPMQFFDLQCIQQKNDTDAIVIKVSKSLTVYSIESFISKIPTEYEEVKIWGYPENKNDTSNRPDYTLISNTYLPPNRYSFEIICDTTTNKIDSVNFFLVSKTATIDNSRHGYSGSPVFIKNKKTKKWVFIGLNWGHGDFGGGDKYLALVRSSLILSKINQESHKRH